MFTPDQHQLIDFGDGRRLERFGPWRLDRPCPAVEHVGRGDPDAWQQADARFERGAGDEGRWSLRRKLPQRWTITHGPLCFELKPTPVGHLGVFPEQAANWDWITDRLRATARTVHVLNLFAYTGGSTLAAAAAGAEIVHVDAARNSVAWARRNAELSQMAERPIRWITEDALKFVKRELRRGNQYGAVILDPPSYGHGPRGEVWRLPNHLPQLLELCGQLTAGRRCFIVLTCHTPDYDPERLKHLMINVLGDTDRGTVTAEPLMLRSVGARSMPSGVVVRWQADVGTETHTV
jgi:23S rRNA (cytosine1962-C5)-methyltransferase